MRTKSILIAEDDRSMALPLKKLFELNDFIVYLAEDGAEALEIYKKNRPGVLLLDIDMPEKDGYEVAEEVRSSDRITPIIIMTGARLSEKDCLDSYSRGAYVYFRKPFSTAEILACINNAMDLVYGTRDELSFGKSTLCLYSNVLKIGDKEFLLKEREMKTLLLLLKHKNHVVSINDLLLHVWKGIDKSNYQMLRNLITGLKKKLGHDSSVTLDSIYGKGYMIRF